MNPTHEKIIAIYEDQYMTHPSYMEIAKKVNRSKSVVAKVIQEYLRQAEIMGLKKKNK